MGDFNFIKPTEDDNNGQDYKFKYESGVRETTSQYYNWLETLPSTKEVKYVFDNARNFGLDYTQFTKYISKWVMPPDASDFRSIKKTRDNGRKSRLGTAIERYVQITSLDYKDGDSTVQNKGYSIFLDVVFISANRSKNIVKTNVVGARGTVKELTYENDTTITLTGQFVDNSKLFPPTEVMKKLFMMYELYDTFRIYSDFCSALGVDFVMIESIDVNENTSYKNVFDFQINLLSDQFSPLYLT